MAKSLANELMQRRAKLIKDAQEIAQRGVAEDRDLTSEEQTSFDQMIAEANKLHERATAIHNGEKAANELEESFRSVTGRTPEDGDEEPRDATFVTWARSARPGDTFDLPQSRQIGRAGQGEQRDMSATGGVGKNSVSSQLWEYALHVGQILQSGVDIINTADGNALPFPVATAHAETDDDALDPHDPIVNDESTITTVESTVAKYGFISYVPTELIQDATFDLEGYIARNAGRELGRRVSAIAAAGVIASFTTAGVTAPAGVLTTLGAQTAVGEGTDLIYKLFHSVYPEYRTSASWIMSDPTAAIVRALKGSDGQSVWQPALTAGDPDLLVGKPVYIVPQIAAPAANAKSMFFGDLSALKVRIAGGLRFERSSEYKFGNDQVAFRGIVRAGAVGLDPNAVKYLLHPAT
ncbi:phage major capsid protein [Mycobacterium sp. SMC-4]|uniref:phage major capsid protein n=1 Tax=Mycobacterium sp. SMC-4 TaxID=2857059 RepID=UPI0021B267A1|nr:phage major capsid protein [Mycobacterium sp. SMC-4]UXA19543.1 phage major capsid protein [Mycobacterium sp. SMC-4]